MENNVEKLLLRDLAHYITNRSKILSVVVVTLPRTLLVDNENVPLKEISYFFRVSRMKIIRMWR